jgi:type VI secretion system protein ImpJ
MRVKPAAPARVVWEEGMFLAPHHFQAQRRHFEEGVARVLDALFPFAWGVSAVAVDAEALANGTLALAHARGVLPDGTPFHLPEADLPPPPLALDEHFAPTGDAQTVYLVLPPWRRDAPNVDDAEGEAGVGADGGPPFGGADPFGGAPHENGGAPGAPRYVAVVRTVVDEASGRDAAPIRFASRTSGWRSTARCPTAGGAAGGAGAARRRRPLRGRPGLRAAVPHLRRERAPRRAAPRPRRDARGQGRGARGDAGAGRAGGARGRPGPSAYVGNEVATRWLLHAVRSAEAPLRHLAAVGHAHPERLWGEVSRLAGALCTFSLGTQPRDLPAYAHDDLAGCFGALERHVRAHLDAVVAPSAVVVPLARPRPCSTRRRWRTGAASSPARGGSSA